ncbi:MAG: class I SAM-dependent methyltransferase [Patescibacteria group bacterium]
MRELIYLPYRWFLAEYDDRLPGPFTKEWHDFINNKAKGRSLKLSTASSFGYEWKRFSRLFEVYRLNFLNYIQPFKESDLKNKVILDAGCGVGRHTYWAAKFGAKQVIGLDLSDAVEPADENCRHLKNVNIIQADIYNLPFGEIFDFIFSIGVLHHLPDPEAGFRSLTRFLKPAGIILIWVYGRLNNNAAVYFYEPIRKITRHINKKALVVICYPFAGAVHGFNRLADLMSKLPLTKKVASFLPFQYYRLFPFEVKLNDAFDVLATPKSRYYKIEKIRNWFKNAGFSESKLSYLRKKSIIAYSKK